MSLNVIITQTALFNKKPLPLEVILGDELGYGSYEDGMTLTENTMGNGDFIAYHPDCPGRGISVFWKEGEMKMVDISLPTPSYKPEIEAFYRMIKRITDFWKCKIEVDGNKMKPDDFQKGLADTIDFNLKAVVHFSSKVLSSELDELTLYSAYHPLILGKKEAAEFKDKPENYGAWLFQKQNADAAYECPWLYQVEGGILGKFYFPEATPCIFPKTPFVPFSATDPQTGKMIECNEYRVLLFVNDKKEAVLELEYGEFLSKLSKDKVEYFDGGHILVKEHTAEEIIALAE